MKATFALLADRKVYNLVRKIAWEANRKFGIGIDTARLEPHVSLKQPFQVLDLQHLETYMGKLAASISPFDVHITRIQAVPTKIDDLETGILWFDIEETSTLRELHQRINNDLEKLFGPTPALFDGDEYHFHMTIAMGNKTFEIYQSIVEWHQADSMDYHFEATELALFVYDEDFRLNRGYMTYKILPFGR